MTAVKPLGKLRRGDRVVMLGTPYTVRTVTPKPAGAVHVTFDGGSWSWGPVGHTVTIEDAA